MRWSKFFVPHLNASEYTHFTSQLPMNLLDNDLNALLMIFCTIGNSRYHPSITPPHHYQAIMIHKIHRSSASIYLARTPFININQNPLSLTNDQVGLVREVVLWNLEVERCRSLANATRNIVMRTVARAEPSAEVTSLTNGHASQMCADT